MKKHFDVLVIGSPCVDLIFSGLPRWPAPGREVYGSDFALSIGAVFNTAATLTRLGMSVALLCEVGNDIFSRLILDEIERAGISHDFVVVRDYAMRAISVSIAHEGERGFVSYADARARQAGHKLEMFGGGGPEDDAVFRSLRERLVNCDFDAVFLYANPARLPVLEMLARHGRLAHRPIFIDAGWYAETLSYERIISVVRYATYFMPNQLEATLITGAQSPEEAVRQLAELVPTVVVKVGPRGVVACQQGQLCACPALSVDNVVDTTGAGDAFNGGFIYGILQGYTLVDALRCGTICGSLSTTALGGTAAVPDAGELERIRLQLM